MRLKHRQMIEDHPDRSRASFILHEIAFWILAAGVMTAAALLIHFT
jgi:hypothetical protein